MYCTVIAGRGGDDAASNFMPASAAWGGSVAEAGAATELDAFAGAVRAAGVSRGSSKTVGETEPLLSAVLELVPETTSGDSTSEEAL